jgi:hypothetical protein
MRSTRRHKTPARLAISLTVASLLSTNNTWLGSAFTPSTIIITDTQRRKANSTPLHNSYRHRESSLHNYILEPNAGPIHPKCRLTEDQIHTLISKRQKCKRQREYDVADKILAALNECGVYLHDKRGEWRADGKNHFGRRSDYVRRGSTHGLLSEEDIIVVSTMVEDRSYAKKRGEFHISDKLGDTLKTRYRVKVDDKNREWSVENIVEEEEYVPTPLASLDHPTHTMEDELKTQIAQRLAERSSFRKKRNYGMADKILEEVMAQYSVVVDDRTKEWKVMLGDDFEDDDFVQGAQLSQRSAFVRGGKKTKEQNKTSTIPVRDDIGTMSTEKKEEVIADANQNAFDFAFMTVVELKEQLRQAGLPVSGKKTDLILRLSKGSDRNESTA